MIRQPTLVADHRNMRYQCPLSPDKVTYTISGEIEADFYIPDRGHPFQIGLHALIAEFSDEGTLQVLVAMSGSQGQSIDIRENIITTIDDIAFHIEYQDDDGAQIYLETEQIIYFGRHQSNKVTLPRCLEEYAFVLNKNGGVWALHPFPDSRERIYINGRYCETPCYLENGDIIHFDGYRIRMADIYFTLYHQNACAVHDLVVYEMEDPPESRYPDFQRPPRILYPVPTNKVTIPNPPSPPQKDRYGLLIMVAPMLAMLLAMTLMSILIGRGIYMLVMVGAMSITTIITAYRYLKEKKRKKEDEAERQSFYEGVLNKKRKEIRERIHKQRQALDHTYPMPSQCVQIAQTFSPRLWERALGHTDFFSLRIGTGNQPLSFTIEYSPQETKETAKDPLSKEAEQLAAKFTHNPGLPVNISLKDAYIGVVGSQQLALAHTLALLTELCVLHSYLDMSLILIGAESQEPALHPFKWTPHTWLGDRRYKGLIHNKTSRDNILISVLQTLKQRQNEHERRDRSNKKASYLPLVIVVADLDIIYNHPIMEFLSQDNRHLGVYAIFLSETEYALPESATTILTVLSSSEATLYQEQFPIPRAYVPDTLTTDQAAQAARALAPIRHIMTSADETMPETVSLFELFRAETASALDIPGKWRSNKPYKTLSVPLGLRSADDILELNLHERAHGPHGLLAGTTGSGKSEILQSYIISLAIHFHPHDVAFLLIDYKGGGMANAFAKLPHLLGTITNLDGAQAMRALIAIKSELRRRQTLMARHDVNHIDAWQKLCAANPALEPMPHLFIISDEFAELKREQPEFIKELVSAARIGRSLGVHLILATQKPTGVVDDQIWSNANFKICLKVQNAADSNEMIKTPDAADIKVPGRGYLQVGNNVIYELFQSAYSGAPYHEQKAAQERPDDNIYLWNNLGQAQLLTRDFSIKHAQEESAANPLTELDVAIQAIARIFDSAGLSPIPSPWLPPLDETLFLPDLIGNPGLLPEWEDTSSSSQWVIVNETQEGPADNSRKQDITVTAGMLDEIEKQRQTPLTINFTVGGHIGVFGSPGSGKSTFLHTIALGLALGYTPGQAAFFVLDFGNNSLLPLQDLPHTAAAMTLDDKEKLTKLQNLLLQEMKQRKDILGTSRVSSIALHNRLNETRHVPNLFIFIDNLDPVREQERFGLENIIKDISRDGQALAIYLIFTASRPSAVRPSVLGNIQTKFMFHMIDIQDVFSILGKTQLQSEKIPGRGLTGTSEGTCIFQAALPVRGKTEEERIQLFRQITETIHSAWQGPSPLSVPMMPDILTLDQFLAAPGTAEAMETPDKRLPVALKDEDLQAFCLDFAKYSHYAITGTHNIGKTNFITVLLESLNRKASHFLLTIVDDSMHKLNRARQLFPASIYLTEAEGYATLIETLTQEVNQRKESFSQKMKANETISPVQFYATMTPQLIIINNLNHFLSKLSQAQKNNFADLIENALLTGIHFCFVSNVQDFPKGFDRIPKAFANITAGITFVPLDQPQFLPSPLRVSNPRVLKPGEAYYLQSGKETLIKIPLINSNDNP